MRAIYLDHNATTPLLPEVGAAIAQAPFGNPSSLHGFGQEAKRALDRARTQVARFAGVEPDEVLFTSGGTEADNLALQAAHPFRRLVVSAVEHSAIREPAAALEASGLAVATLPVDGEGKVEVEALAPLLKAGPALVSVQAANHEVGTLQPLADLAACCRDHDSLLHTDAVQAAGRLPLQALGADLLSLSAHKLGGPMGVGALIVRRGIPLEPLLRGGPQEYRLRAGTENLPGIVGFGVACELARERLEARTLHTRRLRDRLEAELQEAFPGLRRNGPTALRLPNTLSLTFPGLASDELQAALDLEGIAVSTGAACASEARKPSPILLAMGRSAAEARATLRFSLGETTTEDDLTRTREALQVVLARMGWKGH